jgi:hypothetical protein
VVAVDIVVVGIVAVGRSAETGAAPRNGTAVGAVHYTDLDCIHIALAVEALVQENRFEIIKIEKKILIHHRWNV